MKRFAIILGTLTLLPLLSLAHGGVEETKDVGNYRIELSGATTLSPEAGVPERLNFDLFTVSTSSGKEELTGMDSAFDRVWIRISSEETIHLATWLAKPEGLLSGLTYAFPEAGVYEMTVRFWNKDEMLVETAFTLEIPGGHSGETTWGYAFLLTGIGFLLGAFVAKRYGKKEGT